MGKFRCYIKPFDESGNYQDEWVEVTDDVYMDKVGRPQVKLENNDFDVGVFKPNSLQVSFRNDKGLYSDINVDQSYFKFKRNGSLFKITWDIEENDPLCGFANADECFLNDEVEIYQGFLRDNSSTTEIETQDCNFTVISLSSIFEDVKYSTISNIGDFTSVTELFFAILNRVEFTSVFEVLSENISVSLDQLPDSTSEWTTKTVKEVLDELLGSSNSVLVIQDGVLKISPKDPTADLKYTFYGQASTQGIENIIDIDRISNGLNKTFNFITWEDTDLFSEDEDSIGLYGVFKKETKFESYTDETKQQNILDEYKNAYKDPKQNFELTCPINYDTLALRLLDRVKVDYPAVLYTGSENQLPILGVAEYGETEFPFSEYALVIDAETESYKIMGYSIDTSKQLLKLNLERI